MTDANYYGLARALYTGTWSAGEGSKFPIVNSRELRGSLQYVSGDAGDRLTDITQQRVEYGMLIFVKNTYTNSSSTVIEGGKYYQYNAVNGDGVRSVGESGANLGNGKIPNNDANWSLFSAGGAGGTTGPTGPTGYASQGSWSGVSVPANRIIGGVTPGVFQKIYNSSLFDSALRSVQKINGPCFVSFSPGETTSDVIVALNNRIPTDYVPITYALTTTSNAAWSITSAGAVSAYANGTLVSLSSPAISSYLASDVFSIIYDGTNLNFYYNGVSKASVAITTPVAEPIYLDLNIKQQNGSVKNLVFGYAGSAGTAGTPGGAKGDSGATGPTGASGPLGFVTDSIVSFQRNLTTFYDTDGPKTIRNYLTYTNPVGGGQMFAVQLASFSPTLSVSAYSPAQYLNWDQPCLGFTVQVGNPSDYTAQYISDVINNTAGIIDKSTAASGEFLAPFVAGAIVPAGGNSQIGGGTGWTQAFTTTNGGAAALIRSKTNGLAGGSASATIQFRSITGTNPAQTYATLLPISVNWSTANNGLSIAANSGNIFLKPYTNTSYNPSSSGTLAVPTHAITAAGGSVNPNNAAGTFTYTTPVTPFTDTTAITLQLSSTFARPSGVSSDGAYSITSALSAQAISASFVYPSFYIFTTGTTVVPLVSDIVNAAGNDFSTVSAARAEVSKVTKLGNGQNSIATSGNATSIGVPPFQSGAFWFGIRDSYDTAGLTMFGSGSSAVNASVTNNSTTVSKATVTLYTVGASTVKYNMYGFTVNPVSGGASTFAFASTS